MGYTATGDPFVSLLGDSFLVFTGEKVGPVIDNVNHVKYVNQYISAGYNGHGMPRTGAWYVLFFCSSAFTYVVAFISFSAEAVVQMITANITGEEWIQPDWFPSRYLTWNKIQ